MPRFFFDTIENGTAGIDREGLDLPDEAEAQRLAWTWLREILLDFRLLDPAAKVEVTVRDEAGGTVYRAVAAGEVVGRSN